MADHEKALAAPDLAQIGIRADIRDQLQLRLVPGFPVVQQAANGGEPYTVTRLPRLKAIWGYSPVSANMAKLRTVAQANPAASSPGNGWAAGRYQHGSDCASCQARS